MKMTEQQKQEKRQRDALTHVCNKLMSSFSFGKIKTWRDVYVTSGLDSATITSTYTNSDNVVTFPELKKYCDGLKAKLEESIKARNETVTFKPEDLVSENGKVKIVECGMVDKIPTEPQLTKDLDEDYGLVPSPNERAFLYWFQKKAAAELLKGFGV